MAYANMTLAQREQRRKQQRHYNQAPSRKEAMKGTTNRSREVRRHTLNSESIAMENLLFNPTMEWPTTNSSVPHSPTVSPSDWLFQNPLQHLFSSHKLLRRPMTKMKMDAVIFRLVIWHRQNVPSGQRHALLAHRNTVFERRIGRNTGVSINDGEDHVDESTSLPQSTVTNNGK
jgi:hypothetical protein